MRIGIFGGSFDPIHMGHLILADQLSRAAALDKVIFIPAKVSPHKTARPITDPRHRLAMVRKAISGNSRFEVSDMEIRREGASYTIDTVQELLKRHPKAQLHLMMGTDTARDLPLWRDITTLSTMVRFLIATRPGASFTPPHPHPGRWTVVEIPLVDISSTMIRERIQKKMSIRYLVRRGVEDYIMKHRFYKR